MPLLEKEKEWFIEAPWGKISIIAWGDCHNPPVLLCHGAVDTAASFRPLLTHLPDNFYYIGMELPGNGKSDPFPPGLMINAHDLVYPVEVVVKHFRWDGFVFVGHSLGALIGKLYNLSYPNKITKVIDLDPTAAYYVVKPDDFAAWYYSFFTRYYERYHIYNSPPDEAPKYTRAEALEIVKNNRALTDEVAEAALERMAREAGSGLVRFTYDQRTKIVTLPPFSPDQLQKLYTSIPTPTLTIVADQSIESQFYSNAPFVLDESAYPARNHRVRKVNGHHDIHVPHPEVVAPFVIQFLLYGLEGLDNKAKL